MTGVAVAMEKALHITPAARWLDVMAEQFEYLVSHTGAGQCRPGCESCARAVELQRVLLSPFKKASEVAGLYSTGVEND